MSRPGGALMAARFRTLLAYRAATRAQFTITPALRSRPALRAILAACVASDVVEMARLRKGAAQAAWRVARGLAETAAWAAAGGVPQDLPVLVGVPLAIETGVRNGLRAVALVVGQGALAKAVSRLARRQPPSWSVYGWQLLAVLGGAGTSGYEAWLQRRLKMWHQEELSARLAHARLLGQNDVAMGADSVMDHLWRVGWLLGDASGASALKALAAWKAEIARVTRAQAFYLADVLWLWERSHNQRHDLAGDVYFIVPPGEGTTVLSALQATALAQALDGLPIAGDVPVSLAGPRHNGRAWAARLLRVGDFEVDLPVERAEHLHSLEPLPVALAMGAAWALPTMTHRYGGSPPGRVLPWVAAHLGLAAWAHLHRAQRTDMPYGPLACLGFLVATGHSAMVTHHVRGKLGPDGQVHFPFMDNAVAPIIVSGLCWPDLAGPWKLVVTASALLLCVTGLALAERPVPRLRLASEALWLGAALASAALLPAGYAKQADALRSTLVEEDQRALKDAFMEGRSSVLGLVSAARWEAWRAARQAGTSAEDAPRVIARLEAIDAMLRELQ